MIKKNQKAALSEIQITELVETIVKKAINTQARELEEHLRDIHKRLTVLEKRR